MPYQLSTLALVPERPAKRPASHSQPATPSPAPALSARPTPRLHHAYTAQLPLPCKRNPQIQLRFRVLSIHVPPIRPSAPCRLVSLFASPLFRVFLRLAHARAHAADEGAACEVSGAMGYDGAASPASTAARDAKKKKRGNRSSAKLKQCKLDARREQWLSQVKDGKEAKAAASPTGAGSNAGSPILVSPHPPLPGRREDARSRGGDPEAAGATGQEVGSSDLDSPMHSPGSDNSRGGGCTQGKRCSSNGGGPSLSSGSSLWSSSRSVSEAEDDDTGSGPEEENGVLDDWEAVADALSVDNSHCHQSSGPMGPPEAPNVCSAPANAAKIAEPIHSNTRAWTPDDIFRPQSLPGISKQASFPASIGNCWVGMGMSAAQQGILALPLSCPICYEDLDPTDSSFLPCPCGFHLCLFCHKRILEADGRCPGCRKQYNAVPGGGETAAAAGRIGREMANAVPVRLSRSCSMGAGY